MKRLLHISFLTSIVTVLSLFGVSCVKEDISNLSACGYTNIHADIATYSPTSEDLLALGAGEYVIRRCRLYAFDGNTLDNMVYFDNITSGNLGEYIARIKVKQTVAKKLYCIINEPDNAEMHSRLALINDPAAFKHVVYDLADYVSKAYNSDATFGMTDLSLPMYGETTTPFSTITSTPETDILISMTVTRSVARVDVYMQTSREMRAGIVKIDNTTKLDILNTRASGYLAPTIVPSDNLINITNAASGPSTALVIPVRNESDYANAVHVFTFYTPEHLQDADTELELNLIGVDVNGARKNYTVSIKSTGANGLNKIERNKSHKLICTFAATYVEIILKSTVTKWDDDGVDGYVIVDSDGNYHGGTSIIYPWDRGGLDGYIDIWQ